MIYVYCISNSPFRPLRNKDFKGLKSLNFGDFCVIVKYVSEKEFSEVNFKKNLSDIQWVELNAREHIRVINMIMESDTVIPFKFGTIYNTKVGLKKFISDYSDSLIENFQNINGKEEWAVKIYCDHIKLAKQIDEVSEEAAALEKQIMASSPGKAFILNRKKTDLIVNETNRLCKKYGQEYYDGFKNLSESTILNNLLPKEYSGRMDSMILNATFLVSKNKVSDFKSIVDSLKQKINSFMFIEVTGPWPPFSFINIKEKK